MKQIIVKKTLSTIITLVLMVLCVVGLTHAAEPASEQQLIGMLESKSSTPQEKDAACVQLKRIGTARSVPALAALLTDKDLSHSARYALETMPAPEAGKALIEALDKTSGLARMGIIDSLGQRHEAGAVSRIVPLLADSDLNIVRAAATSLGKLAGLEASEALLDALPRAGAVAVRNAIRDALFFNANQLLAQGKSEQAAAIFTRLNAPTLPDHVRMAATRGLIAAASPEEALERISKALQGGDGPSQQAALQMAREVKAPRATEALCEMLVKVSESPLQAALIEALRQRGDTAAEPSIIKMTASSDPNVRVAALRALGDLGDGVAVAPLTRAAASTDPAEHKTARQALLDLRHGNVSDALVAQLAEGNQEMRPEVARALTMRGESGAVAKLIALAGEGKAAARPAVLQVLGQLAGAADVAALVQLAVQAGEAPVRAAASEALRTACARLQGDGVRVDAAPVAAALANANPEARAALLPAASALTDARLREALRGALKDSDTNLRTAAEKALCEASDIELLPDLIALAKQTADANQRIQVVRGAIRLATEQNSTSLTAARRVETLKQILDVARRPEEKWAVLAGLAVTADPEALKTALPMLEDAATRAEAAQAVIRIAVAIQGTHGAEARAALKQVVAAAGDDPAQRQAADAALKQMDAMAGFITRWQVAGPFTEAGKECAALFDTTFAPEKDLNAKEIAWRPIAAGTTPEKPWLVDLLKAMDGTARVAYARTVIESDKAQPARLELGFDDGVKAWLNGEQVYANKYQGALQVGMGKTDISLKQGENTLLLKITQNNMMWEFCARLTGRDGTALDGVRSGAAFGGGQLVTAPPQPKAKAKGKKAKGKKAGAGKKKAAPQAGAAPQAPRVIVAAPKAPSPVPFHKEQLDGKFRSEGVAVADFNNDGKLDIATGNILYLGPDWKPQPMLAAPIEYNPEQYSNEFYCFAEDIDRDGWTDLIVVGFPGAKTRWLKNPGKAGGPWTEYLAIEKTGNESPDWLDVDKDGRKELVFFAKPGGLALAQPGPDPTQPWPIRVLASPGDPAPPHGLGVGDLNGDGRADVLCPEGWWEQPADPAQVPWTFHRVKLGFEAPAQMCVMDVDGDGDADVISSGAHRYGLWWYEQTPQGWVEHTIDNTISQLHALHLADINGDGLPDIVTGKRFWAHMHNDEGINDPAVLCWFELQRKDGKSAWVRHDLDQDSGVGLHFQIVDVNGDGLADIVTSHKKGVYLFTQERERAAGKQ